jgi:hypothetical protein
MLNCTASTKSLRNSDQIISLALTAILLPYPEINSLVTLREIIAISVYSERIKREII